MITALLVCLAAQSGRAHPAPVPIPFGSYSSPSASFQVQKGHSQSSGSRTPGSFTGGTWQNVANQPSFSPNVPLLLTDGTVLVQDFQSNNWWKLTPDNTGNYVNGTWSQMASMDSGYTPTYFASAVLPDGRVFVTGGEYNGGTQDWTNLGSIYDPVANSWTALSPPTGWTQIGDAQCVIHPDGTLMLADPFNQAIAFFNATTLTWTIGASTGKDDVNDEEGWTLLPDGTILSVDVANAGGSPNAQRYVKSSDSWISAGTTTARLEDPNSEELGPAVLRYDGTVVAFGATGHISVYTPPLNSSDPGTWAAAPDFPIDHSYQSPLQIGCQDAPACLMPNGNVLVMAGPFSAMNHFLNPSTCYEFDTANGLNQVAAPAEAGFLPALVGGMLLLPNGQVLWTSQGDVPLQIYTPVGGPQDAWRPTISTSPAAVVASGDYTISGTQFNGFSQNSAYGDDLTNATNYPLVRITNNATSHVFYCRTHDHSTMAVATGGATVSTNFTVPANIETGDSTIQVVTNGIPSNTSFIQVGAPTITLNHSSVGGGGSVTGTVTLTGNAPTGGASITFGSDNVIATTPSALTVPEGSSSTTFEIDTTTVNADTVANLTVTYGAITSSSVALTVKPQAVTSVAFGGPTVVGGNNVSFTVTLSSNAPVGGTPVNFTCPSGLVIVPASLSIPSGTSSKSFTFATQGVFASPTNVALSASTWNLAKTATIEIDPATVSSITAAAPSVVGGNQDTITVSLNGAAPARGESTILSSSSPSVSAVGGIIVFASQAHQATVRMNTTPVSTDTVATISVPFLGGATGSMTVSAPTLTHFSIAPSSVVGGNPALLTVSLNGAAPTGGLNVSLNSSDPSVTTTSVTVPAGNTYVNAPIQTTGVTSVKVATITPTPSATPVTLTVNPPSIVSIAGAGSVTGGKPLNVLTTLNVKASNSNGAVHLSSSNTGAATVSDINVANGSSTAVSAVTTHAVATSTSVTITASNSQNSQTFTFNVLPAALLSVNLSQTSVASGGGTFGVVYLTGATASSRNFNLTSDDATHITLTPSTVTIGTSGTSASFTVKIKAGTAPEAVHITVTDPVTSQTLQVTLNVT
jgi:hypothetical protein